MKKLLILALLVATAATAKAEQVVVQTKGMSVVLNVEQGRQPQYVYFGSRLSAADLSHLQSIKEKMNDPDASERIRQQLGDEKVAQVRRHLETLEATADSVSLDVQPIGRIAIEVVDRQPSKCVKYTSTNSPIGFNLWVQLVPTSATECKMKLTVDAQLNPFMAAMIEKPLKEGINKMADMLATLPYE